MRNLDGIRRKLILPDPDVLHMLSLDEHIAQWDRWREGDPDFDLPIVEYRITRRGEVPPVNKRLSRFEFIFVCPSCEGCGYTDLEYSDENEWEVCDEWRGDKKIFCRRSAVAYRKVA